jgi:hypothetical protein
MYCQYTDEECNELMITEKICTMCMIKKIYEYVKEEKNDKQSSK